MTACADRVQWGRCPEPGLGDERSENGFRKHRWHGVADQLKLPLQLSGRLEVARKRLYSCALPPRKAPGLMELGSVRMAGEVLVLARELPLLLPAIGEIRPDQAHRVRGRVKGH